MTRIRILLVGRKVPLGLACLAVVLGAALFAALNPLAASHASPISEAAQSSGGAQLPAFQRSRSSADALPTKVEARAAGAPPGDHINTTESRKVFTTSSGNAIYVVPGEGGKVCVIDSDESVHACFPASAITNDGDSSPEAILCSNTIGADNIEIAGIVPTGAKNATVILANGTSRPLRVHEDVYVEEFARDGALPERITWTKPEGGTQDVSADIPAGVATEHCVESPAELEKLVAEGKIPSVATSGGAVAGTSGRQ